MINWNTRYELPRLRTHAQALAHWENVVPIRGDENKTRPVGRRDQKWFCITHNATSNTVHLGYGWAAAAGEGDAAENSLITYYPDGRVVLGKRSRSASCRERIEYITGMSLQRYDNRDWVNATTYQEGEAVSGWFILPAEAVFILRENNNPILLNAKAYGTHIINKQGKAAVNARYKAFKDYLKGIAKVTEGVIETPDMDGMKAILDVNGFEDMRLARVHGWYPPDTKYASRRAALLSIATSEDTEQMYKAMLWLNYGFRHYWYGGANNAHIENLIANFERTVTIQHHDECFKRTEVRDGRIVRDRYRSVIDAY